MASGFRDVNNAFNFTFVFCILFFKLKLQAMASVYSSLIRGPKFQMYYFLQLILQFEFTNKMSNSLIKEC